MVAGTARRAGKVNAVTIAPGGLRFQLGPALITQDRNRITLGDRDIQIEPRIMDVLCALARRAGDVVSRDTLIEEIWGVEYGGDDSLTRAVSILRKTLGADAIETVSKRGYRLTRAPVPIPLLPELWPVQVAPLREETSGQELGVAAQPAICPDPSPAPTPDSDDNAGSPHVKKALVSRGRRVLAPALALGALAIAAGGWTIYASRDRALPDPPAQMAPISVLPNAASYRTIVVLPFEDKSPGRRQAYLADGLAEQVRAALGAQTQLHVLARNSSSPFSLSEGAARAQRAADLRVDLLLEGSIDQSAKEILVGVRLVEARTGDLQWTREFKRNTVDVLQLQVDVANDIATLLGQPGQSSDPPQSMSDTQLRAYRAYLEGDYYYSRGDTEALKRGLNAYRRAVLLDPSLAEAFAKIAVVTLLLPHDTDEEATMSLLQAQKLAPGHAETLWAEAFVHGHKGDARQEDEALDRLLKVDPDSSLALTQRIRTLNAQLRFTEAESYIDGLMRVDPIGWEAVAEVARTLVNRGKPQIAIDITAQALQNPGVAPSQMRFWQGAAYCEEGDILKGMEQMIQGLESAPQDYWIRYFLARILAHFKLPDQASSLSIDQLSRLQNLHDAGNPVTPLRDFSRSDIAALNSRDRALAHILQHDLAGALPWLNQMVRDRERSVFAEHDSDYKPYLELALRHEGQVALADQLDTEIQQEIERLAENGMDSKVLFLPFRIYASAARGDRPQTFALLNEDLASGGLFITLNEAIFDDMREDPMFQGIQARFEQLRQSQQEEAVRRGYVARIDAVIRSKRRPPDLSPSDVH